ncbi:MAG: thiamine pyrophosphate-dependent dehydrogenase E1 component subunit alpha [Bryobacterales bacterium]|nr:thiamine pyrophosphate-dependent dehydrogenase E1 component subunit alpha [Bryobacterales bacterium]MDE0626077.1 thiamine pyrophosphate-dependent dehydrogenase E1 component subunit alpha [Bryobacterales bacterium]
MSAPAAAHPRTQVDRGLCESLLYYMLMMRELEERIELKLYRQGKVLGGCYTGRGQEAIPVGSAILSRPGDWLTPSHRDMAALLIRGITPREILAQYMGRVSGLTRGRDGNMHMGCAERHCVPIISSIGASIPVAGGLAFAMRYRGESNIVFNYSGDGASSRGDWHEGLNMAAVLNLPIVYLCNNNQYAYSTPLDQQMKISDIAHRVAGYGMPFEIVDGNDVLQIHEASQRAVAHARAGRGPYFIECKTFRMSGHSAHDAADYVPTAQREEWSRRDPILMLQKQMVEGMGADEQVFVNLRKRVLSEIEEAVSWALDQPFPDPATLEDDVYESV